MSAIQRLLTAAFAAFAFSLATAKAADVSIGSPVLFVDGLGAPSNVTCYFSNIGERKVTIADRAIVQRDGGKSRLTANTCGKPSGFDLKPGEICYIATTETTFGGYRCMARVAAGDAGQVRASVELRDASPKVVNSAALTTGPADTPTDEFRTIASAPMFGAPDQRGASCLISNLGSKTALLKKFEIRTSSGRKVPTIVSFCDDAPVVKIKPGETCAVASSGLPNSDLRCQASVTRSADIRATFIILGEGNVVLNARPVR